MFSKTVCWLLFLFVLVATQSAAQSNFIKQKNKPLYHYKTLVVYDTAFVKDTIRNSVRKKQARLKVMNPRGPESAHMNLSEPIFNQLNVKCGAKAFTGAANRHKSIGFSLPDFDLNISNSVLEHIDFGLSMGYGYWWAQCNVKNVKPSYTSTYDAGLWVEYQLNSYFVLHTGANFHWLSKNYSYKTKVDQQPFGVVIGESESTTNYQLMSFPLLAGIQLGKFRSCLGADFSFKIPPSVYYQNRFCDVLASLNYKVSKNLMLGFKFSHGLTTDVVISGNLYDYQTSQVTGSYSYFWKTNRLEFSLLYSLKKDESKTATIHHNRINEYENYLKLQKMRKLSLVGTFLLSLQSIVFAQADFGVTAGTGFWSARCATLSGKGETTPTYYFGAYYNHDFGEHLFVRADLSLHYLSQNYSYKTHIGDTLSIGFGDGESASTYRQLSIPLQVGYKIGRLKPFVGLEYSYRVSESWLNQKFNIASLLAGFNFQATPKLAIGIKYIYGVTTEYNFKGDITSWNTGKKIGSYSYPWKSSRYEVNISYSLK